MDRHNVLFFFLDQCRPDWLGGASTVPVRTPNVDRLTDRGVGFANAVCPAPLCGPSRACLAAGMEYDRCGVRDHAADFPLAARTYYGRLRDEADYHVAGCGKFDLQKHSGDWGLDGTNNVVANGFSTGVDSAGYWDAFNSAVDEWTENAMFTGAVDPYMAYLADHDLAETHIADLARRRWGVGEPGTDIDATAPTPLPEHAYCDNWIAREGLRLLDRAPAGRSWHLVVNFAGPHNPWDVTEEMHGWYRDPGVTFSPPVDPGDRFSSERHRAIRRNYAAMIENIDRWVGRYRRELEAGNELSDTIIVVASDHGELLGDHGQWYKCSPYQASVGVPLVVAGPGVANRGVVGEPASVLDVHATVLDFAGLDPGAVDSRSLRPYLTRETDTYRETVYSGLGPWRLAFDGRYKLVRGYDTDRSVNEQVSDFDPWNEAETKAALQGRGPTLFDLETDPGEIKNVAEQCPDAVKRLSDCIDRMRSTS